METPQHTTSISSIANTHTDQPLQNPFTTTTPQQNSLSHERGGSLARRGHSDGDLLTNGPSSAQRHARPTSKEDISWLEFIKQPLEVQSHEQVFSDMTARRRAIPAEDRQRRLSGQATDRDRRSSTGGSFSRHIPSRNNHSPPPSFSDHVGFETFNIPKNSTSRALNRPLPRAASEESTRDRRSQEVKLPKWQPDEEISKCPICGIAFNFWHRKHHCRKCGRVVCANCSPHRITIPRQFIVHPPGTTTSSIDSENCAAVEIIDLTGDEQDGQQLKRRSQSSDYYIDPALGGGQEVRLCNPCVPDPNPLPHMPYQPRGSPLFESLPRIGRTSFGGERGSNSHQWRSPKTLSPALTSQSSSNHQEGSRRPDTNAAEFIANLDSLSSSTSRRHSHASRMPAHEMSPPSMPSAYGSAPDQMIQQVSRLKLLRTAFATDEPIAPTARYLSAPSLPTPIPPSSCLYRGRPYYFSNVSHTSSPATSSPATCVSATTAERRGRMSSLF